MAASNISLGFNNNNNKAFCPKQVGASLPKGGENSPHGSPLHTNPIGRMV
uniref:Uncharacterized protein n=1 Tax=Arundo donax TaxID=35708 RepID=A0A0A9GPZ2_ARUDO